MGYSNRFIKDSLQKVGSGSFKIEKASPLPLSTLFRIVRLSKEAKVRLNFLDFSKSHSVSVTCRHFGISRSTYYRWKKRFNPYNLKTLEDHSKRPKKVRKPNWSFDVVVKIKELRNKYPTWGKAKLKILLEKEGINISESTIGRILSYLKVRGEIIQPARKVKAKKVSRKRLFAVRKPSEYKAMNPGDIIEIDTLDIQILPGKRYKQFTGIDVYSRISFADIKTVATAKTAKEFLEKIIKESPFKVKAVQTDNGSEFCGEFEEACKELKLQFFCLPPRSPKLNGSVERMNRTFREEFWECYDGEVELLKMRGELEYWTEEIYNSIRPHQELGYLSPKEFLEKINEEEVYHM